MTTIVYELITILYISGLVDEREQLFRDGLLPFFSGQFVVQRASGESADTEQTPSKPKSQSAPTPKKSKLKVPSTAHAANGVTAVAEVSSPALSTPSAKLIKRNAIKK